MSELDVGKLAEVAAAGKGCTLLAQLYQMPIEQSTKIMKQIADRNAEDRGSNPN